MSTHLLRAALQYVRRGIPVFPCDQNKRPLLHNGFHGASTDDRQVELWWSRWPDACIGIPTGRVSGFWVLDVDVRPEADGRESLWALEERHGKLPDTVVSLTPSGGSHYLFEYAEQVRSSAGKLGPGLDVRGDGGYVLVAPSVIDGRPYEWESCNPPKSNPAPEWLLALVRPPEPRQRRPWREPTDEDKRRAWSALKALSYNGESRDEWVEIGMAYAAAGGDFTSWDAWCAEQPGYDEDHVRREWESFSPDGNVGPGTLFWRAKEAGWKDGPQLVRSGGPLNEEDGEDAEAPAELDLEASVSPQGEFRGYRPTLANVIQVLERHPEWAGRLRFNELTGFMELDTRELDDTRINELRSWLDTGLPWATKPPKPIVFDAVEVVAKRQAFDPVRQYLDSLQWDGVERLPYWLDDVCGVERTQYTMAVASKFLIGAVARAQRPGSKVDHMPVFVGVQGVYKSTLLRELFCGYHVDTPVSLGSKDAYTVLSGAWCYEFAELASFHGREVEKLKAFFSSSTDTYRPAYGRTVVSIPRRCVPAATTNDEHVLHDATGSRRFWMITVKHVDLGALKEIRDQLWAEAVVRYQEGEPWWMEGEQELEAAAVAEDHYAADPWEERIAEYAAGRERIKPMDVLNEVLQIEAGKQTKGDLMRVGRILRDRLCYRKKSFRDGNRVVKGYVKDESTGYR